MNKPVLDGQAIPLPEYQYRYLPKVKMQKDFQVSMITRILPNNQVTTMVVSETLVSSTLVMIGAAVAEEPKAKINKPKKTAVKIMEQ